MNVRLPLSTSSSSKLRRPTRDSLEACLRALTIPRVLGIVLVCTILVHRSLSFRAAHRSWEHAPCTFVQRQCPLPSYPTLTAASDTTQQTKQQPKICLTTLTDEHSKSWQTRYFGWRNFDGLLALTWENKQRYAQRHGYHLFDESAQLDRSRPASWSKIKAVQRLLNEEACDWVFWLDADTVVMNSHKRVQDFLPANTDPSAANIDLLLSADDGGGYNAGVWLVHNTPWARQFLQEWWNMRQFVKPPGLAKSGDNNALKYKLGHEMAPAEFARHVAAPPRCTFNSFARFIKPGTRGRRGSQGDDPLASATARVSVTKAPLAPSDTDDYYMDEASYHQGDLIAHVAGVDNKVETIKMLLEQAM